MSEKNELSQEGNPIECGEGILGTKNTMLVSILINVLTYSLWDSYGELRFIW